MTVTRQGPAAPAGVQADALIEEARQHQRRRRWRLSLTLAFVVVAAAGFVIGVTGILPGRHPAGRAHAGRVPAPGRVLPGARTTLITWPAASSCCVLDKHVFVDDLSRGRLSLLRTPPIGGADPGGELARVGHWLVYDGLNGVWAIRPALTGRPRFLDHAQAFVPSAVPGQVLLLGWTGTTVRTVSVASGRLGPVISLPRSHLPPTVLAATSRGYLLAGQGSALQLWRPGSTPRDIGSVGQGGLFAVTARTAAYGSSCSFRQVTSSGPIAAVTRYGVCQVLRVIDLASGRVISFAAPAGTLGWASVLGGTPYAISPGAGLVAAPAAVARARDGTIRLFVLRLSRPGARPLAVPRSEGPIWTAAAWSSSSWLFYEGPGGKVWAFRPATGQSASLGIPCRQCAVMISVPS